MKSVILLNHKIFIFFAWFIGFSTLGFAQEKLDAEEQSVYTILKKASKKYQVVFNYNYKELKYVSCLPELPNTIIEFKALLSEYSGLELESYEKKIWIVKKNYTHQIQFFNSENTAVSGVVLESQIQKSNRFGNIFIKLDSYPQKLVFKYGNDYSQELNIDRASPKKYLLVVAPFILEDVIVRNLYISGVSLDANKHIKVKTKNTPLLAGQVQQDAFISLLNLPQISNPSESITELNIKGGVNDQNLMLWNGIKLFQNAHFFGVLSAFNDNLIETITVIDNATPAQYGNAVSGTVILDFDRKYSQKNHYGVGINALSGHAFLRQTIGKDFEFSFAMQRSFTNLFKSPTFESYREKVYNDTEIELSENQLLLDNLSRKEVFYYQDSQFQLKRKINEKLDLSLHGIWFENNLNYTEIKNNLNNKNSSFNNINAAIGINSRYKFDNENDISLIYNFSKHKSSGNNNTFTGNLNTFQNNLVDSYFLQTLWNRKRSKIKYSLGADFEGTIVTNRYDNETTSAFLNLVQISNIFAFFSAFSYQDNRWSIYTGLRTVLYQRDKNWQLEPRFNLTYKLTEVFDLSLRGELKSQNLKQIVDLDQNFLGIEKRRWILSGENELPLQNSNQIEALLQFNTVRFGGYASFYLRNLSGLSSNDQRFQNENQFNSFENGASQIVGSNLHLYYRTKILSSWLSFAYLDDRITIPEKSFSGNNDLNYKITWGNNFKFNRWNISFSCMVHDGLPYTGLRSTTPLDTEELLGFNTINYNAPNSNKLPNYFRIDSSVQYHYQSKNNYHFKLSLGVINLTDNYNLIRKNYRLNRINTNQIQEIETLGLGFTPNVGLAFYF